MRDRMGAPGNPAEQAWTSHQVTLLNEMNGVAGGVLEHKRRSLLNEATTELQRHQRQRHEHQQEYQKFNKKSKSNRSFLSSVLTFFMSGFHERIQAVQCYGGRPRSSMAAVPPAQGGVQILDTATVRTYDGI